MIGTKIMDGKKAKTKDKKNDNDGQHKQMPWTENVPDCNQSQAWCYNTDFSYRICLLKNVIIL